jgi:hypothetical protein
MQSPCEVFSRSDDAVIRVYNRGGDPVQTREDELKSHGRNFLRLIQIRS